MTFFALADRGTAMAVACLLQTPFPIMEESARQKALNEIGAYAKRIDAPRPDGTAPIRLGLICTVYFRNGGQPGTALKVLQCFGRFIEQFGEHLTGQIHSFSGQKVFKVHKDSIENNPQPQT
jgi:hypothetical protein